MNRITLQTPFSWPFPMLCLWGPVIHRHVACLPELTQMATLPHGPSHSSQLFTAAEYTAVTVSVHVSLYTCPRSSLRSYWLHLGGSLRHHPAGAFNYCSLKWSFWLARPPTGHRVHIANPWYIHLVSRLFDGCKNETKQQQKHTEAFTLESHHVTENIPS